MSYNPVLPAGGTTSDASYPVVIASDQVSFAVKSESGTISVLNAGSVVVTNGTIASVGTVTGMGALGNLNAGTVTSVGTVVGLGAIGNLNAGSVVVTAGTIAAHAITNLAAGTVTSVGTVVGVGVIGNLNSGSVVVTAGTIAAHAITNVADGTVAIKGTVPVTGSFAIGTIDAVTNIVSGTIAEITNIAGGTIVTTMGDLSGGTIDMLTAGTISMINAGTITSVGTVVGAGVVGTVTGIGVVASVTNLAGGTIGILTNGTVSIKNAPVTQVLTAQALATGTASTWGTLSAAAGAGTSHYVSGLQIVVHSGTVDCYVGFGTATTGGSVLARGNFVPSAGIMRDFTLPIQSGTNSEICWNIGGAGTASIAVNYWKG